VPAVKVMKLRHGNIFSFRVLVHRRRPRKRSRHFYRMWIFPSPEAMYAFWTEQVRLGLRRSTGKLNFKAQATWWGAGALPRHPNCVGQVIMVIDQVGAGLVSHEMTHAALYYLQGTMRRPAVDWRNKRLEEELAYLQGALTAGFWREWWKHKELERRSRRKAA